MNVQTLDIISVNVWQILISLANLLIMFLILKKFLFKPVQKVMKDRREQVDKIYGDAEESRTAAADMKQQYTTRLAGAREEADSIVRNAQQTAQRRSDSMLSEASSQASRIKQKAEEEIALERKQMVLSVKSELSDMAVSIASKIVEREIDPKDHAAFVDDFIQNVGDKS